MTDPVAPAQTEGVDGSASPLPEPEPAPAPAFAGPAPVFVDVYRAHLAFVWRTLWRLAVPERDIEDVAHDVFVVVHQKLHTYDVTRPMKPWLFGICFRVALDRRRKMSNAREQPGARADVAGDDGIDAGGSVDADVLVARRQDQALVHRALASLPLEQRAVFVLHELDGLPIPECAAVLEAPLNTLYSRLRLARAAFTRFVQQGRS